MPRDTRDLRNENRTRIYELLLDAETTSRTELKNATGISAPTVLRIVDEFIELGIVKEAPLESGALGRPSVGLRLPGDYACSVALLHEGSWISACVMDLKGTILHVRRIQAAEDFSIALERQLPALIDALLAEAGLATSRIQGIGIGLPAILDPYAYVIHYAPLIGVSEPVDISAWKRSLEEKYQTFVCVENDVNALAIGEHARRGLGEGADMAYVALGTGIGAGIILRGKLRRGKNNRAGEIGFSISRDGRTLEEMIGVRALSERFSEGFAQSPEAVAYVAELLTPHLVNFAICFDLDLLVLGGDTADAMGEALLNAIQDRIEKLSAIPVKAETGASSQPGLEGLGRLVRIRFLQQLRSDGLESIRNYL